MFKLRMNFPIEIHQIILSHLPINDKINYYKAFNAEVPPKIKIIHELNNIINEISIKTNYLRKNCINDYYNYFHHFDFEDHFRKLYFNKEKRLFIF